MNNDYIIKATPSNARRLLSFNTVCEHINYDSKLEELAKQDLYRNENLSDTENTCVQYIKDCNYRLLLIADDIQNAINTIFEAVIDIKPIVFLYNENIQFFIKNAAKKYNRKYIIATEKYEYREDSEEDLILVTREQLVSRNIALNSRKGILIIGDVYTYADAELIQAMNEYEKSLVLLKTKDMNFQETVGEFYSQIYQGNWFHTTIIQDLHTNLFNSNLDMLIGPSIFKFEYLSQLLKWNYTKKHQIQFAELLNISLHLTSINKQI